MEKKKAPSSQEQEGFWEPPAWFAVGTEEVAEELLKRCREKNCYFPKSAHRELLNFSEEEAGRERKEHVSPGSLNVNICDWILCASASRNRGSGPVGAGVARALQLLPDVRQQHQPGGGRIQEELPELGLQEPQGGPQHLLPTSR